MHVMLGPGPCGGLDDLCKFAASRMRKLASLLSWLTPPPTEPKPGLPHRLLALELPPE